MEFTELDRKEYEGILLFTRKDNYNGNLPVFIRKVSTSRISSPLHRHEMIQVNYVYRGRLIHYINHSRFELVKGDIFVIPPYIPHRLESIPGVDSELVEMEMAPEFIMGKPQEDGMTLEDNAAFFDFSYIEPFLVSECNVRPRLNLSGNSQMIVESLLNEIYSEYTNREDSFLLAIKADMLKLLVMVGRYFRENVKQESDVAQVFDRHRDAMQKAIQYIEDHFPESISIEDAARVAMLSQSYFSYLFKVVTGRTFVEYLNARRIRHAMELLKKTDQLVVEICFASGFQNVNHFNRTFKNMVGLSPTQYRRANRK